MKHAEEGLMEDRKFALANNLTQNEVFTKGFYSQAGYVAYDSFGQHVVKTVKEIMDGLYYREVKIGQVPSSGGDVERNEPNLF